MRIHISGMKLPSLANSRMHWTVRSKTVRAQRDRVALECTPAMLGEKHKELEAIRATPYDATNYITSKKRIRVLFVRHGPRRLDSDNLQGAFKGVRDEVARQIGIDDGNSIYDWHYEQFPGPYAVTICITREE